MKLSILIASLVSRIEMRKDLFADLRRQLGQHYEETNYSRYYTLEKYRGNEVEIIVCTDNKEMILGAKRNMLLREAAGDYVCFVDCDDKISSTYIAQLLKAIAEDKDCICFFAKYYNNSAPPVPVEYDINISKDYGSTQKYYRMPNHLMCVKRELALQARFPEKTFGEDSEFAKRLYPLLKTQTKISDYLYHYHFNSKTTETQK